MSQILWSNNASTTLATAISSVSTTISVASGTGALFPNPSTNQYFLATLSPATPGAQSQEIVLVSARSSDTLTVTRGQESTLAQAWGTGAILQNLITAGTLGGLLQNQSYAGNPNGYVAGAVGSGSNPPSTCWDSTNGLMYVCTASGTASTAGWSAIAPLNSPAFLGNPTATTQSSSDNSTRLATTAWGHSYAAPIAGNASQVFAVAAGASTSQAVNFGQFNATLGISGSQSLPSGLIIKWGTVLLPATGASASSASITFPASFPSACYRIYGNAAGFANGAAGYLPAVGFMAWSSAGATAVGDILGGYNPAGSPFVFNQGVPVNWWAIGV